MMQLEGLREGFTPTRLGPIHHVSAGQGPALFLIHGGHGGWQHWQANLLALARSHTVVAIDMPGYGLSARLSKEPSALACIEAREAAGDR